MLLRIGRFALGACLMPMLIVLAWLVWGKQVPIALLLATWVVYQWSRWR
jgi:hypothetical protein